MHKAWLLISAVAVFSFIRSNAQSNEPLSILESINQAYAKRDTINAGKLMIYFTDDVQVIGTGYEEWISGKKQVHQLLINDWLYWFNIKMDLSKTSLGTREKFLNFSIPAEASISFPSKEAAYAFISDKLKTDTQKIASKKEALLTYMASALEYIKDIERDDLEIRYALRVTGTMVKATNGWKINSMCFSFPYPMHRLD